MLWRALKHIEHGFYLDVGANDPTVDSVTQFFYEQGWCGINIEPLTSHWQALQEARLRDINLQCVVGSFEGEIKLWECDVRGWATTDEEVIAHHETNGHLGRYTKVRQTTLNQLWLEHVPLEVHFLKIDVEGSERSVLEGLDLQRFRPWIVVVEATRPNTMIEVHAQWEHLLLNANYQFVYADGLNRFYIAGEHQELKAAFSYPPNFFDHFVTAPHLEGNLWAQTIATRAEQALQDLAMAEQRAAQALALAATTNLRANQLTEELKVLQAHATDLEAKLEKFLNKPFGRLTRTIRRISNILQQLKASRLKGTLKGWSASAARYIVSRPLLRKTGAQLLTRFPATRSRLKNLVRSAPTTHSRQGVIPLHLAHLAPRVRALYAALQDEWQGLKSSSNHVTATSASRRLRLAYVSPLPPARSGIADYSAELLPALAQYYDIDIVIEQPSLSDAWINTHCRVRDAKWLLDNPKLYDRVLYHLGNSSNHQHMFHLLTKVPGIVVLHDFYLGDVLNYLEAYAVDAFACQRALYKSHGYGALAARSLPGQFAKITEQYPANFEVLQLAQGVIVHSQYSKQLANTWYGPQLAEHWSVIPLLRLPNSKMDRNAARQALGLQPSDFIVCSFGLMGPTKLNHRLLKAWLDSSMADDETCKLVFVGEVPTTEYGAQMKLAVQASGLQHRIHISGWTDPTRYRQYLMAADLAVQLRANSRGETSAAVLDCLNYGLPTIVNAHGSLAELSPDTVCLLADDFEDTALTQAIDTLWRDANRRQAMGQLGRECIQTIHAPNTCADQYRLAIERHHATASLSAQAIAQAAQTLTSVIGTPPADAQLIQIAQTLARQLQPIRASRQLLVDVSATCKNDLKTGIQRVVRALVWSLIQTPPEGFRVEPVYLNCDTGIWHYCYAREWTSQALGISSGWLPDDPVDPIDGDVLLIADFTSGLAVAANQAGVFSSMQEAGVGVHFFVYDLLPIQMPHCFPPGEFGFSEWLNTLTATADSAICISQSVALDLQNWITTAGPQRDRPLGINWFHLGADLVNSIPTSGLAQNAPEILHALQATPSFLMVGTIEPRKGYLQTIQAFTQLWQSGVNINLVIVGHEGWTGLPNDQRQTIPQIMRQIQTHPELGKRLLWLKDVSDEYLAKLYSHSVCLIAASEGEGFGLPLIEAAQQGLPIIARDLPVFREVAGEHAFYFEGLDPPDLAQAIQAWLVQKADHQQPQSQSIPWLTWAQSTKRVIEVLQHANSI